jgi:hypothetical protein
MMVSALAVVNEPARQATPAVRERSVFLMRFVLFFMTCWFDFEVLGKAADSESD